MLEGSCYVRLYLHLSIHVMTAK